MKSSAIAARAGLLCGTAALLMGAAPALAQAVAEPAPQTPTQPTAGQEATGTKAVPAGGSTSGLEEIVVTARRVTENLQTVPISVGTLTAAALQNRQIASIQDLKGSVVGLTTSRTATVGGGYITIRGVTALAVPQPSADSGVGYYVDGVYIARNQGAGAGLADVSRVEVLRGPQGTLFGRNSANGSINFVTNEPTKELHGSATVLYGNYDHLRTQEMLNVPITDNLIVRVAHLHDEIDGDVKNSTTSPGYNIAGFQTFKPAKSFDQGNTDSYVAKLRFTGIDGLTLDYKYDDESVRQSSPATQLLGFIPSPLSSILGLIYPNQAAGVVTPSFSRLGTVNNDFVAEGRIRNFGHMLQLNYELTNQFTLRSITAYRSSTSRNAADLDGGDWSFNLAPGSSLGRVCVSCSINQMREHAWSQENQLLGKFDRASFVLGFYYFDEFARFKNTYSTLAFINPVPAVYTPSTVTTTAFGTPGDFALGNNAVYNNRSYAGYGHFEYKFSDRFDIALGGRYTADRRETNDLRPFGSGVGKASYNRFTYDAAINYRIDRDKLVYAKYATGYVSGGVDSAVRFRPEDDRQVEVGLKTEWLDRKLRVNAAGYYTWIRDRQNALPNVSATQCSALLLAAGYTVPCPVGLFVYNLPGTSTVKGMELEVTAAPARGVSLSANFSYNDPHNSDGSLQRAPKTNFAFSGQYDFPQFDNGSFVELRVDGDYRSSYYGTGANSFSVFQGEVPAALRPGYDTSQAYLDALLQASKAGDYWLVNARASLVDFPMGTVKGRLSGFVRNLTNTTKPFLTVNLGYYITGSFERPRTYGAELSFAF